MTYNNDVLSRLESAARQSDDAAKACDAQAAAFRDEYETLCSAVCAVNYDRMAELYTYVVERPREARRLRGEAELFRTAIAKLKDAAAPGAPQFAKESA